MKVARCSKCKKKTDINLLKPVGSFKLCPDCRPWDKPQPTEFERFKATLPSYYRELLEK